MSQDRNKTKRDDTVVSLADAEQSRWLKRHQQKDEKVAAMAQRFAQALPDKATPVKDFLRKKRAKKKT